MPCVTTLFSKRGYQKTVDVKKVARIQGVKKRSKQWVGDQKEWWGRGQKRIWVSKTGVKKEGIPALNTKPNVFASHCPSSE